MAKSRNYSGVLDSKKGEKAKNHGGITNQAPQGTVDVLEPGNIAQALAKPKPGLRIEKGKGAYGGKGRGGSD